MVLMTRLVAFGSEISLEELEFLLLILEFTVFFVLFDFFLLFLFDLFLLKYFRAQVSLKLIILVKIVK